MDPGIQPRRTFVLVPLVPGAEQRILHSVLSQTTVTGNPQARGIPAIRPTGDHLMEFRPRDEELGANLTAALQRLSEIERVCFVLKHLEQWRLKEISQELDASIGTIKQALFRAVKKLRLSMADIRSN